MGLATSLFVVVVCARRRSEVHIVATTAAAAAVVLGVATSAELLFFEVPVAISFVTYSRIPSFIGVERAKTTTSATPTMKRLLVRASCGSIISVLDLAHLIIEPADDAARCWLWRAVWAVISFPRQI
jgi:hypothetical protein